MTKKERIDILLVERDLAESRNIAQRLVMAGQVRVEGQVIFKPSRRVQSDAEIIVDEGPKYVSRGGDKLVAALTEFDLSVRGLICADVGASTGGFTDCLLQHGAKRVYAVDVGHGQLHWRLRNDPRVTVMEGKNARYLKQLQEKVSLVTIDVSFISLHKIFPSVVAWLTPEGQIVALVKPQFEAGREAVGRGGVVREIEVLRQVLVKVVSSAREQMLFPAGLIRSPLLGPKGNTEFLLWLMREDQKVDEGLLIDSTLPIQ
jgi:23S rRNA (cytidine1920-2'-O)/16S rRNA (cytidine1409-2'-O)-methyltransferase